MQSVFRYRFCFLRHCFNFSMAAYRAHTIHTREINKSVIAVSYGRRHQHGEGQAYCQHATDKEAVLYSGYFGESAAEQQAEGGGKQTHTIGQ